MKPRVLAEIPTNDGTPAVRGLGVPMPPSRVKPRTLMVFAALFAAVLAFPLQEAPKPPIDRSGEPELRRVLKAMGAKRHVTATIERSAVENRGGVFEADRTTTLFYDGPLRFRVVVTSMWGDSLLYVSDGKTLYFDPLDDTSPAILQEAKETVSASHTDLAFKGRSFSILFNLLQGEAVFDSLVAADSPITTTGGSRTSTVQFKSKDIGAVTLFYLADGTVIRAEYDNKPAREAQHQQFPEWVPKPEDPVERELFTFSPGVFAKGAFSAAPPKGRQVMDRRKKG